MNVVKGENIRIRNIGFRCLNNFLLSSKKHTYVSFPLVKLTLVGTYHGIAMTIKVNDQGSAEMSTIFQIG